MLPTIIRKLLRWYDQYDDFNIILASFLFAIQLAHLFWLTTDVVIPRIFNTNPFLSGYFFNAVMAVVDYTEIPAIITTSLVYAKSYKRKPNNKDAFYLFFLNVQWLHIFWITDDVVVQLFGYEGLMGHWNQVVVWMAISIDYLELPVIVEMVRRSLKILIRKLV